MACLNVNKPLLFILTLLMFIASGLHAQMNYADVKVDELTDTQVRLLIQRAESMGYNDSQIEQMALMQGMKASEVEKLKTRITSVRSKEGTSLEKPLEGRGGVMANTERTVHQDTIVAGLLPGQAGGLNSGLTGNQSGQNGHSGQNGLQNGSGNPSDDLFEGLKPQIFGASLFRNGNIRFEPNLRMATPSGYIIGPDDELLIDLMGENEQNYKLKVTPDGNIRLEYVGLIAVGGLSMEDARAKIRSAASRAYPAITAGRTSVAVNIGNIRQIKVTISGEATRPGTYSIPSLASVYNALYLSGGPNERGSLRNVQVIRDGDIIATVDAYDFLLTGIQSGNINLRDQDVIHIPVYQNRVLMQGEVKRPAYFEMKQGETLAQLLDFAGGFSEQAYAAHIKLSRNTPRERMIADVSATAYPDYLPQNGDQYMVEAILDRYENRVEISGSVFRPGHYALTEGLTVRSLIEKAEGLTEDAFTNRAYLQRLNVDNTHSMLSIDLARVASGADPDITLQREDRLTIPSLFDLRDEYRVQIQGEVRFPGQFAYAEGMDIANLILLAGGFREGATPSRIEVSRRIKNSDALSATAQTADIFTIALDKDLRPTDQDFRLEPFDIVYIRSAAGYYVQRQVTVHGEILFPGVYTIHSKDEKISDLIQRAGGLTPTAYTRGASLLRARSNQTQVFADSLAVPNLVGIDLPSILSHANIYNDLLLEDGDILYIPKQLQTVQVSGAVLNPNGIIYEPGKSLRAYVNGAGGFKSSALKKGIYVKYANGEAQAAKRIFFVRSYPRVLPGSEIIVPAKGPKETINTQGWVAISTGLASLAAIVLTLFR